MVKITDSNYISSTPELTNSVEKICFLAFDFEFFGLENAGISLFDSPEERYKILRKSVQKFKPSQLGISFFIQEPNGRFKADYYSIPLVQRKGDRNSLASHSAMEFLISKGFDLNKVFRDGVSYCDRVAIETFSEDLKDGNKEKIVDNEVLKIVSRAKLFLHEKLLENWGIENHFENCSHFQTNSSADIITLESKDIFESSNKLLTSIDRMFIIYELTIEYPKYVFNFIKGNEKIECSKLPGDSTTDINISTAKNNLLISIRGVADIFQQVSDEKIPIVGHNCLLDLMYIINYFFEELPENYLQFKNIVNNLFPIIIDTKFLATSVKQVLKSSGADDLCLDKLGEFFVTPESEKLIPSEIHIIDEWKHVDDTTDHNYHDAGFDAFVTGEIFVKLSHIYIAQSTKRRKCVGFRRILEYLRIGIINRIPFTLIDVACCNLKEDDDVGTRPDVIRVQKRNCDKFTEQELDDKVKSLKWFIDCYKFDARLSPNQRVMEIVTNTAPTFAFVFQQLSKEPSYQFDEDSFDTCSFEQHLTSFRSRKNGNYHFDCSRIFSRAGMIENAINNKEISIKFSKPPSIFQWFCSLFY